MEQNMIVTVALSVSFFLVVVAVSLLVRDFLSSIQKKDEALLQVLRENRLREIARGDPVAGRIQSKVEAQTPEELKKAAEVTATLEAIRRKTKTPKEKLPGSAAPGFVQRTTPADCYSFPPQVAKMPMPTKQANDSEEKMDGS